MTRSWPIGALILLTAMVAPAGGAQRPTPVPAPAAAADTTRMVVITYISGQSVYVGAGSADGVREGMTLEVMRARSVIATVKAVFLSSRSSSCEVIASTTPPAVGDSVRYRPVIERPSVVAVDTGSVQQAGRAARPAPTPWRSPVRGHAGIRYLSVVQPNAAGVVTQPSADLHLDAPHIGGSALGVAVDGRSRRTIGPRATPSSPQSAQTLLYEASVSLTDEGSGARVSVGRQYSAALSSVSLFDGFVAEVNRPSWGIGAFGGVQPDAATMSFSTTVREAGGFLQFHNRPAAAVPWSVTTGAVGSRELGELNREFAFAQIVASGRFVTVYAMQEVDVNRGWKLAAGEPAFSPTSSFAMVQIRPANWFGVQAGVDNRRNVRLYRDYVSPETEFDDAFRQGTWGGANLTLFRRVRLVGDARTSRGGSAGAAAYYTGSVGLDPVTPLGLEGRVRSTSFKTDRTAGWLHAWSAGAQPVRVLRFEVSGGLRMQQLVAQPATAITLPVAATPLPDARWIGATIDLSIGRSWYLLASGTRDGAGAEQTNQLYYSLVYRF